MACVITDEQDYLVPSVRQKICEFGPELAGGKIRQPPDFIQRLVSRSCCHHDFHARQRSGRGGALSCRESASACCRHPADIPIGENHCRQDAGSTLALANGHLSGAAAVSFSLTATAPLPMRLRR